MKTFACGDVVPGCDARWVCSSDDEILVAVASHARTVHGMATLPDPVIAQVLAHVGSADGRSAPAV